MNGRITVVGIGPGSEAWRSPEVSRMVAAASSSGMASKSR